MTYWQYREMIAMWGMGKDTYAIAKILGFKESYVYHRLASHLAYKHKRRRVA